MLLSIIAACSTPNVGYQENVSKTEMTYCLVGDTGTGDSTQMKVADSLRKENCDHIFILGDVIYPKGIKSPTDIEVTKKFISVYQPFQKPFTLVMGNHDYEGSPVAWQEIAKKSDWIFYPSPYFLQKINDICFLVLDTNYYQTPWPPVEGGRQKQWLDNVGSEMKDCRYKVALAHHPYLSPARPAEALLKKFYEDKIIGKVDALVTGHDHILADVGEVNGTRLLISGAGGKHDNTPGYLLMKVSKEIQFEFKEVRE